MEPPLEFKLDCQKLLGHLKALSKERNFETTPASCAETAGYLRQEFSSYGLELSENRFHYIGQTFSNWIARINPSPAAPRLILGAHFDSVAGSPGADDNASGVAALLECARAYANHRRTRDAFSRPLLSVEFAAFNLEEYGMVGSRAYARHLKEEQIPVAGMLSLEMIGYTSEKKGSQKMPFFLRPFYPDVGNFIALVSNSASRPFLQKVQTCFAQVNELPLQTLTLPGKGWLVPDTRLSDHSPFWDEGYPALLVTDTSFFRNPHYHSPADRIETLNLDFLAKVTEAVLRTLVQVSLS